MQAFYFLSFSIHLKFLMQKKYDFNKEIKLAEELFKKGILTRLMRFIRTFLNIKFTLMIY